MNNKRQIETHKISFLITAVFFALIFIMSHMIANADDSNGRVTVNLEVGEKHVELAEKLASKPKDWLWYEYLQYDSQNKNITNVTLEGSTISITVPSSETIGSVISNLQYSLSHSYGVWIGTTSAHISQAIDNGEMFNMGNSITVEIGLKPIEEYSTFSEYRDEFNDYAYDYETPVEDDQTFFMLWHKPVDSLSIEIEQPVCGEQIDIINDRTLYPSIRPTVECSEHAHVRSSRKGSGYTYWTTNNSMKYYTEDYTDAFEGIIRGSTEYCAAVCVDSDWGYYFTRNIATTVNYLKPDKEEHYEGTSGNTVIVYATVKARHDYAEWVTATAPTCSHFGTEERHCKGNCGSKRIREINFDEDAHNYGAWTKLDNSYHQRICAHNDNHVETEQHSWDNGKVTKPATESSAGIKTYTCKICKAFRNETIAKLVPKPKAVLVAKGIASGKTNAIISWNKVNGAQRYVIYMAKCNAKGKKYSCKKVKTTGSNTFKWKKTKLAKNTYYKFYVVAQKKVKGKYKNIVTSKDGHFITGNQMGNYTNPKDLKLNKSSMTLKKGKTLSIKGTITKAKSGKRIAPGHSATYRFISNNPKIASVNSKGKVTAISKGSCIIYVQTINGIWKTCKITVS